MSKPDFNRADSRRRHRALLDAAADLFIEIGFEAASLNELVARAGGSKSSIYAYFRNKEGLFTAVVDDMVDDLLTPLNSPLPQDQPFTENLLQLADHTLEVLTSKKGMGLSRIVVTESTRIPAIGRHFYNRGPGLAIQQLANYLDCLARAQQIQCDDPEFAAEAFWGMLLHKPMLEGYCAISKPMSNRQRTQYATRIVETFVARFC